MYLFHSLLVAYYFVGGPTETFHASFSGQQKGFMLWLGLIK